MREHKEKKKTRSGYFRIKKKKQLFTHNIHNFADGFNLTTQAE